MVNFIVTFFAMSDKDAVDDNAMVTKGYTIGTKEINRYSDFSSIMQTAFGKTLPGGDILVASVSYHTKYRGANTVIVTADNLSDVLSAIETSIDAKRITLDELLAEPQE